MSVLAQATRLNAAGRSAEAVTLVTDAAEADDVEALYALAHWRLYGLFGPQDPALTHQLLARAAALGSVDAVLTRAILLANGTGCAADFAGGRGLLASIRDVSEAAARQLALLDAMPDEGAFAFEKAEILCADPPVRRFPGLLTPDECAYLIEKSTPHLTPSFVIDPRTGGRMPHPIRTSAGMNFGPTLEDLVVRRLNERIARISATDVACGEPLHVLRYSPGQEYKPHTDSMPGEPNPRAWTVLVYLNEGFAGGATHFPRLDLTFRGRVGEALIFCNVTDDGRPDGRTLHAGLPIEDGVKWLATRWLRDRQLNAFAR